MPRTCSKCGGEGEIWQVTGRLKDGTPVKDKVICDRCKGGGQL